MIIRSQNKIINTKNILNENIFKNNISLDWNYKINKYYTIFIYTDFLINNKLIMNKIDNKYCFYLATNIINNDINYKNEIIPYTPLISTNNNITLYYIKIYEHDNIFNSNLYKSILTSPSLNLINEDKLQIVSDKFDFYKKIEKIKITHNELKRYLTKYENIDLAKKYFNKDVLEYTEDKQNKITENLTKNTLKFCSCLIENILNKTDECLYRKKWNSNECSDPSYNCDINIDNPKDKCICASLYDFDKLTDDELIKLGKYFNIKLYNKFKNNFNRKKAISILINEFNIQFNLNKRELKEDTNDNEVLLNDNKNHKIKTRKPLGKKNFIFNTDDNINLENLNDNDDNDIINSSKIPLSKNENLSKKSKSKSPSRTTKSPSRTTKSPNRTTKSPSRTTKSPIRRTKSPSSTTETPSSTTETPSRTTETPSRRTKLPSRTTKTQSRTTKSPSRTTKSPSLI